MQPSIKLKRGRVRPIWAGNPWVFSGAIGEVRGEPGAGDEVEVLDARDQFVGWAFFNPDSAIRARMHSWVQEERFGPEFLERRLAEAKAVRERLLPADARLRRWFNGEGDLCSGLTVDGYGDWLVLRVQSRGLADRLEWVVDGCRRVFAPRGIVGRPDTDALAREGIAAGVGGGLLWGEMPPPELIVDDGPARFQVDLLRGQKTGFYADQRDNRRLLAGLVSGSRVLDLYAYSGAFAIHALKAGAVAAVAVDSAAAACTLAEKNGALNGVADRLRVVQQDAFDALASPEANLGSEPFDLVVVDPPKLARRRGERARAVSVYDALLRRVVPVVASPGWVAIFSCSAHIPFEDLERQVALAARRAGRPVQIVRRLDQAGDHPVHPACPQTRYLSGLLAHLGAPERGGPERR